MKHKKQSLKHNKLPQIELYLCDKSVSECQRWQFFEIKLSLYIRLLKTEQVMKKFVFYSLSLSVLFIGGCGLLGGGGGQPTSVNPGEASSATGMEYNAEGGFAVNEFQDSPKGQT